MREEDDAERKNVPRDPCDSVHNCWLELSDGHLTIERGVEPVSTVDCLQEKCDEEDVELCPHRFLLSRESLVDTELLEHLHEVYQNDAEHDTQKNGHSTLKGCDIRGPNRLYEVYDDFHDDQNKDTNDAECVEASLTAYCLLNSKVLVMEQLDWKSDLVHGHQDNKPKCIKRAVCWNLGYGWDVNTWRLFVAVEHFAWIDEPIYKSSCISDDDEKGEAVKHENQVALDPAFDEVRERYVDACDEVTNLTGKNDTVQNP